MKSYLINLMDEAIDTLKSLAHDILVGITMLLILGGVGLLVFMTARLIY